jgi:hypothetical protein
MVLRGRPVTRFAAADLRGAAKRGWRSELGKRIESRHVYSPHSLGHPVIEQIRIPVPRRHNQDRLRVGVDEDGEVAVGEDAGREVLARDHERADKDRRTLGQGFGHWVTNESLGLSGQLLAEGSLVGRCAFALEFEEFAREVAQANEVVVRVEVGAVDAVAREIVGARFEDLIVGLNEMPPDDAAFAEEHFAMAVHFVEGVGLGVAPTGGREAQVGLFVFGELAGRLAKAKPGIPNHLDGGIAHAV